MFEIREIKNKNDYNPPLINKNAPFTQAWFYGEWQEAMGRKVRRFEITDNSKTIGYFQVIKYPMPFKKSFLYIPHGPIFKTALNEEFLKTFFEKLKEIAIEESAIFIRFDTNISAKLDFYFKKTPISAYHSVYFQPKDEWTLDIGESEEELLKKMHPKYRYGIRLAENRGVIIEIADDLEKYFEIFYKLLSETAKRNKFNLHPKNYYRTIFSNCAQNKDAFLVLAKYDKKIIAANFILLFGETAYFLLGGSSNEFKNVMAPHLAHWRGIVEAKNRGYKFYNFGAVDADNKKDFSAKGGPASGWGGISRFKKRFGGRLLEYSDSYDLILKQFWFWLYNLYKKFQIYTRIV